MATDVVAQIPMLGAGFGYQTPYGITLPPGGRVGAFVRSTGSVSYDDPVITSALVTTLGAGLARCRALGGDTVVVLPGHSESVADATMLDNLVAGTTVVGCGRGSLMPTFTWTAAAANWAIDNAGFSISGCRLDLGGFNGVTEAISVDAADCAITNCDIVLASSASLLATLGIDIGASGDRAIIARNRFRSVTGDPTTVVGISGACKGPWIRDNVFTTSAPDSSGGQIYISAAALNVIIDNNIMANIKSGSTFNIVCGAVAATGIISRNMLSSLVGTGTAPASTGISLDSTSLFRCLENYSTPTKNTSGLLTPAADS